MVPFVIVSVKRKNNLEGTQQEMATPLYETYLCTQKRTHPEGVEKYY